MSTISWISLIGLALGVIILILVSSVMNGFERELKNRILNIIPHGLIYVNDALSPDIIDAEIAKYKNVQGWGYYREGFAVLHSASATVPILVMGIEPDKENVLSDIESFLLPNAMYNASEQLNQLQKKSFNLIIGAAVAENLAVTAGDKVTMILPEFNSNLLGTQARFKKMNIIGVLNTKSELDTQISIIHHADVELLYRSKAPLFTRIRVDDVLSVGFIVNSIVNSFEPYTGSRYSDDWTRRFGTLFQSIKLEQRLIALMLMSIILIAAFNIYASIAMTVEQSKNEIAILRTIGTSRLMVALSFLYQGVIVGGAGILFGVLIGVSLAANLESIFQWLEASFGIVLFDAYFIHYLPSQLEIDEVFLTVFFALCCCIIFSLTPSWKAGSIDPALVLSDRE